MLCSRAQIESSFISVYREIVYWEPHQGPTTLYAALARELPHIEATTWPERVAWGGVFVNGIEANGDLSLPFPARIEYYEPRFPISEAASFFPSWSTKLILYEDEDILCVMKPPHLPCVPAREQKYFNLKSFVEQHVGHAVHLPSRLDMSTAGLLLMSKATRAHRGLQRFYEQRLVNKYYLFETAQEPEWQEITINQPIGRDAEHPVLRRPVISGGKSAETEFSKIAGTRFVVARPRTGRTHQIRVHAAYNGFAVYGDYFYGIAQPGGLRLLSYRVALPHPIHGRALDFRIPMELAPEWSRCILAQLP